MVVLPTFATQLFGDPKINSLTPKSTNVKATKDKIILNKILLVRLRKDCMQIKDVKFIKKFEAFLNASIDKSIMQFLLEKKNHLRNF